MGELALVGLGPGDPHLLPAPSRDLLATARAVFLRSQEHPVVPSLTARAGRWTAFDALWDGEGGDEEPVERAVVAVLEAVRSAAAGETVALAVPGSPLLDDALARRARAAALAAGLPVRVLEAPSLLDPVLAAGDGDPGAGLQVVDSWEPRLPPPLPGAGLVVTNLRERVLGRLSRWLLESFPPDHVVALFRLGARDARRRETLTLSALAVATLSGSPCVLSVPPVQEGRGAAAAFGRLVQVVARLRAPGGCPWDRAQTHRTLRPYVVEEAWEVVEAIEAQDPRRLAEELGDLLLQVVLHAVIAQEGGHFGVEDVVRGIAGKVVRRHPHVFGGEPATSPGEVERGWEAIKRREKGDASFLPEGESRSTPALMEAEDLQSKAAGAGFDWPSAEAAWPKVEEELAEFRRAWAAGEAAALEEELGDVLFALANVARLLNVNPELALKASNRKFARRFREMERVARAEGRSLAGMSLAEMDRIWERVKAAERPEEG